MTVRRNKFLVNKTNRRTEFQFYWYYYSTCFGQPFCPSSEVLRRTSALVHFMQLWWQFTTRTWMELQFHPASGSKRLQLHKMYQSRCMVKNSWWWAERLPQTCSNTNKTGIWCVCWFYSQGVRLVCVKHKMNIFNWVPLLFWAWYLLFSFDLCVCLRVCTSVASNGLNNPVYLQA